jgi:hypothetical protein
MSLSPVSVILPAYSRPLLASNALPLQLLAPSATALSDPTSVDPNYLTAYRRCALVEGDESTHSAAAGLGEACKSLTDLGASGVERVLGSTGGVAVLRVLELESHVAVQLIGPCDVSDAATRCLAETGARRFHDLGALPQEIANLST